MAKEERLRTVFIGGYSTEATITDCNYWMEIRNQSKEYEAFLRASLDLERARMTEDRVALSVVREFIQAEKALFDLARSAFEPLPRPQQQPTLHSKDPPSGSQG